MQVVNSKIQGASDLYFEMVRVKNTEYKVGGCIPQTWITKKQCKDVGISWGFVEKSAEILGLKIEKNGRNGFSICK